VRLKRRIPTTVSRPTIEQLQYTGAESFSNSAVKSKLALNHPCKELIWVFHLDDAVQPFDYADSGSHILTTAKLQLNGHDRFSERKSGYFSLVQPYQHHTRIPDANGIYVYSFALNPEAHQPSGTVNMSRIDNATLQMNTTLASDNTGKLKVFAVNYNVLRVMAGIKILYHLCQTVSCLLSSLIYLARKTVKIQGQYIITVI